ncbi:hypothetical protein KY328_03160 [Candidatus Woesearchaeota archaeon]|nr:hypothetical protein [Candidatus Woesearchaeota archaeon]MBW3021892.1 hypothetical protein [Candidatus Woesearchaeota archaeon]
MDDIEHEVRQIIIECETEETVRGYKSDPKTKEVANSVIDSVLEAIVSPDDPEAAEKIKAMAMEEIENNMAEHAYESTKNNWRSYAEIRIAFLESLKEDMDPELRVELEEKSEPLFLCYQRRDAYVKVLVRIAVEKGIDAVRLQSVRDSAWREVYGTKEAYIKDKLAMQHNLEANLAEVSKTLAKDGPVAQEFSKICKGYAGMADPNGVVIRASEEYIRKEADRIWGTE